MLLRGDVGLSQNLVPNPSFEVHRSCPERLNNINKVQDWQGAGHLMPDYFHQCAQGETGVPQNAYGHQSPSGGRGYAGITVVSPQKSSPPFIYVELNRPLRKNQLYEVRFSVNLADSSYLVSDAIGAYLSKRRPSSFRGKIPQVYVPAGQMVGDKKQWTEVKQKFLAQGGERYLTIGNFYPEALVNTKKVRPAEKRLSYYYIDEVTVTPLHKKLRETKTNNLVLNGNFEYYYKCPGKPQQITRAAYWNDHIFFERYHDGTTDYYHACNRTQQGVPNNEFGSQLPYSGEGYAGMRLYSKVYFQKRYGEYLQGTLREPLEKDSTYLVEAFVNCSDSSQWAIDGIGIALVSEGELAVSQQIKTKFLTKQQYLIDFIQPDIMNRDTVWGDKERWVRLGGRYKAKGGENKIIIGRFVKQEDLQIQPLPTYRKWAYYYFDQISVRRPAAPLQKRDISAGMTITLNRIHFAYDEARLLPASYGELNQWVKFLKKRPKLIVKVAGHTDSLGSDAYNKRLSRARAQSVVDYFVEKGVSGEQLKVKGYGSTQPVAPNTTSLGRAKNRRVTLTVIHQK